MRGRATKTRFGDNLLLVLAVALAVLELAPITWVIALSIKPNDLLMHRTEHILAPPFTTVNYRAIVANSSLSRWIFNSVVVASCQTLFTLILCSLAGYGFSRTRFPGQPLLFANVLTGLAVPEQAVIIPLFKLFADAEWHNTYAALILPRLAAPFSVFLMAQYFGAIPPDIDEVAILDNASRLRIFWRVILPLSIPAQATLSIYTFLVCWNDYLWPLISATRPDMYTLTIGLASAQTNFAQSGGLSYLMAGAVAAGFPVLSLYLFFQCRIVSVVAGTARR